jgi:hypothetical protein
MTNAERAERIKALVASFGVDDDERDRLKSKADEALARLHEAAHDFAGTTGGGTAATAPSGVRPAAG